MGDGTDGGWDDVAEADLLPVDAMADELELVGATLRGALARPLPPGVADAHVRLMVSAHAGGGPKRPLRRVPRPRAPRREWPRRLVPVVSGVAAAGLAAAALAGALPGPVQARLAGAAAHIGVTLPGRDDHHGTWVSTPTPTTVTPTPTTPTTLTPTTVTPSTVTTVTTEQTVTTQPPTDRTATTATTLAAAPPPPGAPETTLPPRTTAPPTTAHETPTTAAPTTSTTPTTKAPDTCVNPALISATATLETNGKVVDLVIRTSGTVPYMSATIDGMTGVVENLTRTSFGFQGTLTAPTTVPAGSTVVFASCGNQIRGSAPIN